MKAIEKLIVEKVAEGLIKRFGSVVIDHENGYDPEAQRFTEVGPELVDEAFACDECQMFVDGDSKQGYGGWVTFIYGNGNAGLDVISDYTANLDEVMKPISDMIDGLEKGTVELEVA